MHCFSSFQYLLSFFSSLSSLDSAKGQSKQKISLHFLAWQKMLLCVKKPLGQLLNDSWDLWGSKFIEKAILVAELSINFLSCNFHGFISHSFLRCWRVCLASILNELWNPVLEILLRIFLPLISCFPLRKKYYIWYH